MKEGNDFMCSIWSILFARRSAVGMHCFIAFVAAALLASCIFAQGTPNPEAEPNDNKGTATIAASGGSGLQTTPEPGPADTINGTSRGSGTGTGLESADYYRVKIAPAAKNIYCYSLEGEAATGHVTSIRALIQNNGVVVPDSDRSGQTSFGSTPMNIWYGTGANEEFYLSVVGSSATTEAYSLKLRCILYEPAPILPFGGGGGGAFPEGFIALRAVSTAPANLDFWVYDENLHAIPNYGHDDPDATGLTRFYTAGRYYVAISDRDVCNNQPSPQDDAFRNGAVADFPDIIFNSSPVAPIPGIGLEVAGGGVFGFGQLDKVHAFQVLFFTFDVAGPTPPCPVCIGDFNNDGGIDGSDVNTFFVAWEAGDECGDVNADGGIDGTDVAFFFERWENGAC